eukprot:14528601-Alexandrium_andersonii.AAC.1
MRRLTAPPLRLAMLPCFMHRLTAHNASASPSPSRAVPRCHWLEPEDRQGAVGPPGFRHAR